MPKALLENGVKLHYQLVGQGPALVMIHGLSGNLAVWHLQIAPLLWDHFQMLTYDLRGHGYSDTPPAGYSPDDMAEDLYQLLDSLEIERPFLVGHSYGADLALYFAYHHPERVKEVVAVEAALPAMIYLREREEWEGWDYWSTVLERSGHPVPADRRTDVDYLLRTSLAMPKKWGPLKGLPRNAGPFLRLLDTTTVAEDSQRIGSLTLERLPDIEVPVTLIYSESSAFLGTYDYLKSHLKRVRPLLLPPTEWGHFGPLEQPELVADCLLKYLARDDSAMFGESKG